METFLAPSKTGCSAKGVVAGAATALVVGAVATVAAPVVGAVAVTVGLGALAVAGTASLGWTASHDTSNHNWAGVAYDAGSLVGGLATGIAGGPKVATSIDPNATPGWSSQSWSAQAYDRAKGSLGAWSSSFVLGGYAGAGASFFITNAGGARQLRGPFTAVSVNVGVGVANHGVQLSVGGGIWQLGITPPLASVGIGAAGSVIRTNTITTHAGCQ